MCWWKWRLTHDVWWSPFSISHFPPPPLSRSASMKTTQGGRGESSHRAWSRVGHPTLEGHPLIVGSVPVSVGAQKHPPDVHHAVQTHRRAFEDVTVGGEIQRGLNGTVQNRPESEDIRATPQDKTVLPSPPDGKHVCRSRRYRTVQNV